MGHPRKPRQLRRCIVCDRPWGGLGIALCSLCGKSYDAAKRRDGTVLGALVWAAARSRWFERARWNPSARNGRPR